MDKHHSPGRNALPLSLIHISLSNLLTYGSNGNQVTAKDRAAAKASYAALQQEIMAFISA